jgi:hypothetical protein
MMLGKDQQRKSGAFFMLGFSQGRQRRTERRCRPAIDLPSEGILALESRLLLNASHLTSLHAERVAHRAEQIAARRPNHTSASSLPRRLTPAQEINAQYAAFTTAFNNVLNAYVQSINEQSSGMVSVSATVTTAYASPSPNIEVDDASVFGSEGTFSQPVVANATLGTVSLGTFTIIGSSGNTLIINVGQSAAINLPVGAVLSANVPTSAQTSAAAIFPSYITNSTTQLATNLVKYFNSLPVKLPVKNTPPHTPVQNGAIQAFVFQNIAGSVSTSLQQLLLATPLPTTPGSDLVIYQAAADSAIAQSRQFVLSSITQIFNRNLLVNALAPANRLGESFNSSSSGSGSSGSTSTSTGTSTSTSTSNGTSSIAQ